jgi:hypothetical protein
MGAVFSRIESGGGGDNTASLTIIQEQEAINRALQTDTHRYSIIYRQIGTEYKFRISNLTVFRIRCIRNKFASQIRIRKKYPDPYYFIKYLKNFFLTAIFYKFYEYLTAYFFQWSQKCPGRIRIRNFPDPHP